jgi:hypothetical protein
MYAKKEYEAARCNRCFRCRSAIGNIYGFWGAGWNGQWDAVYEPKVETWKDRVKSVLKHGFILGAQIAAFSAVFIAATREK